MAGRVGERFIALRWELIAFARVLARKEALEESLRLLYALTRAKFRCYLVAGEFSD